jgi:hypothetical protein
LKKTKQFNSPSISSINDLLVASSPYSFIASFALALDIVKVQPSLMV